MLLWLANLGFLLSVAGILLVTVGNPLTLLLASLWKRPRHAPAHGGEPPTISLITVAHRPGELLQPKLSNSLALEYPANRIELIFFTDGQDPFAMEICNAFAARAASNGIGFQAMEHVKQRGKNACLNDAVAAAKGEVLVFSDVDAMVEPTALRRITAYFSDTAVGGVGGRRMLSKENKQLAGVQSWYWSLDAWMKRKESQLGAVTANDGKLYAMRRSLFQNIPDGVTDDLYNCLTVLRKRFRFLYESEAVATVPTPSRSGRHEIARRRRIVCRGLRGVWLSRVLLNPLNFGWIAVRLCINKVLRRLLPLMLLLLLLSTLLLSFTSGFFLLLFIAQMLGYALAMLFPILQHTTSVPYPLMKLSSAAYYVCMGMIGTWIGVWDFLQGRVVVQWISIKAG